MTVLVTGGAGYIGSHAVKNLKNLGYDVVAIDNLVCGHKEVLEDILKVPLVIGEIGDEELIKNLLKGEFNIKKNSKSVKLPPISAVMHFAALTCVGESLSNPAKYYKNNVCDSLNLINCIVKENSRRASIKGGILNEIPIVFSSTCATYGIPKDIPINEDTTQEPINPYGRSKLIVESFLKDFGEAYNLKSIIFRYFNVAGADPKTDIGEWHIPETHLIPLIFDSVLGKREKLEIYGTDYPTKDGTCIRDYIHVEDLVSAHILGMNNLLENISKNIEQDQNTEIFNLGNGEGFSVKEIVSTVEKITTKKVPVKFSKRRKGDPHALIASSEKAYEKLNWKPKFSEIDLIIKHAWDWHNKLINIS